MKPASVEDPDAGRESCAARVLTAEESWQRFDAAARHYLQLSGEAFLRAWDAGQFDGQPERTEIAHVLMLRPVGR